MSEVMEKFSINRHFRREAVIQAAVFLTIVAVAAVGAFVGPLLFELLR